MMKHLMGAALAATLTASVAQAGSISYDSYTDNGFGVYISAPGVVGNVLAGQVDLYNGGNLVAETFCVDVFDYLQNPGTHTTFPFSTASLPLPGVPSLSQSQLDSIGWLVSKGLTDPSAYDDGITQLAIWSTEYGSSFVYSAGSGVVSDVNALVAAAAGQSAPAGWSFQFLDTQVSNQTLVTGSLATVVQTGVPEPSTWAMLGLGFGGLALFARRRKDSLSLTV